ncbi:MAG TPA: MFS transporter, partial [Chroococcales cyanobacterium]
MWNLFKETYIGPLRGPKRKVRQYLLGKLLSGLGSWGQAAAFAWVAAQVSGSISAYGLVIAARKVPTAATLVSGKLVDRWSPKAVLLVVASVQSMHAALLFSLWQVGQLNLPWLVALA